MEEEIKNRKCEKIAVIGVGGAGSSISFHAFEKNTDKSIEFMAIDTDKESLNAVKIPNKLFIEEHPSENEDVEMKIYEKIKDYLSSKFKDDHCAVVIFSTWGFTGNFLGYVVLKILEELQPLIVETIIVLPFKSEKISREHAFDNLPLFQKLSDIFIVIENDLLLKIVPAKTPYEAFTVTLMGIIYPYITSLKNLR